MKQLSDKVIRYQTRGMLLPIDPISKSPIFLEISEGHILPIFTTRDKFKEAAEWGGFKFAQANVIVNPQDFQDCVFKFQKKFPFYVVIDPYMTEDGNTRFQLVPWDVKEEKNGES